MITNSSARGHRKKVKWRDLPLSNSDKSLFTQQLTGLLNVMPRAAREGKKKSCKLAGKETGQSYLVRGGMGEEGRQPPPGALALEARFAPSA